MLLLLLLDRAAATTDAAAAAAADGLERLLDVELLFDEEELGVELICAQTMYNSIDYSLSLSFTDTDLFLMMILDCQKLKKKESIDHRNF